MEFVIEGLLDAENIYKRKKKEVITTYYKIIEENYTIKKKEIIDNVIEIAKKFNFFVKKQNLEKAILMNEQGEKIILKYEFEKYKVASTFFIKVYINIVFEKVTPNLLLIINSIYEYLESKTKLYRKWRISYIGKTYNRYIIKNEDIKMYSNAIILTYEPRKEKEKSLDDILELIISKELKSGNIYRYYKRKKYILDEILHRKVEFKIPMAGEKKYNYKDIEIIYKTTKSNYKTAILRSGKYYIKNIILREKNTNLRNEEIEEVKLYKCVAITDRRKKNYYEYYVTDILFRLSKIENKNAFYFEEQQPYLRLYSNKEIKEKDVLNAIKYLKKQDGIKFIW